VSQHPALPFLPSSEKGKIVTAAEAVRLIRDGDTVATGGFVGIGFAEEIALALEELYLASEADAPYTQDKPRNLTLVYAAGQGDVSRYTTSGFLRIKLGEALEKRGVAAHIFESADEAQSDWRNVEGIAGLPRNKASG
jgi:propionate CoA-transferase